MKFELKEYYRNLSDQELIDDLRRVAHELKKASIKMEEYDKKGKYSNGTLRKRFGGWQKALKKAGLQKSKNLNITDEMLFQNLEEVWIKLGRQPIYTEMQAPLSKYSVRPYHRFGAWSEALRQFVNYINEEGNISSEEGIKKLRARPGTKHKTKRDINWRLRFLVMKRDNFKCKACGRSPATNPKIVLHVDHIKAWANGGETVLENLQTLCSKCNIGKSNVL